MRSRPGSTTAARKVLSFYRINFDVVPPYTAIVDSTTIHHALTHDVYLKQSLPRLLGVPVYLTVTSCTIKALKKLGDSHSGAALFAKRLTRTACAHNDEDGEDEISETECIKKLLLQKQKDNNTNFIIVTNHSDVSALTRRIPHVPLIALVNQNNRLVVRPPGHVALNYIKEKEEQGKQNNGINVLCEADRKLVLAFKEEERNNKKRAREENNDTENRPKKKRAKGPNPLSTKKSKKKSNNPALEKQQKNKEEKETNEENDQEKKGRRRPRRSKKTTVTSSAEVEVNDANRLEKNIMDDRTTNPDKGKCKPENSVPNKSDNITKDQIAKKPSSEEHAAFKSNQTETKATESCSGNDAKQTTPIRKSEQLQTHTPNTGDENKPNDCNKTPEKLRDESVIATNVPMIETSGQVSPLKRSSITTVLSKPPSMSKNNTTTAVSSTPKSPEKTTEELYSEERDKHNDKIVSNVAPAESNEKTTSTKKKKQRKNRRRPGSHKKQNS